MQHGRGGFLGAGEGVCKMRGDSSYPLDKDGSCLIKPRGAENKVGGIPPS
jgi:hypothetical protein